MEQQKRDSVTTPMTIWQGLDEWATDFKPWQRLVLSKAIRHGRLTDAQVDQAYSQFLYDNSLGPHDPAIEIPSAISGRPASATPDKIWLSRICGLRAINALPSTAELTFSSGLTIVYGGNGVGKSGFTRVLSNVCFSRTHESILPDVYSDAPSGQPAATITISEQSGVETSLQFDGLTEHEQLKRIAIFDTAVFLFYRRNIGAEQVQNLFPHSRFDGDDRQHMNHRHRILPRLNRASERLQRHPRLCNPAPAMISFRPRIPPKGAS